VTESIVIDNTKRKMFKQCKQKYLLSAIHGWQPDFGSTAIRYGVAWHAIQEGYHGWIAKNGWPKSSSEQMEAITAGLDLGKRKWDKETEEKKFFEDYRNFNTLVDNFNAYLEFFSTDKDYIKIITTETKFECPILPENSAEEKILDKLPPLFFTGRIDLCVEMDYQKWIFDFKTTGWILDKVIAEANRSPQLIGYSYAGKRVLNFEPNGCLASFSFAGSSKSRKTGEYGAPRFEFRRVPQLYTASDIVAWKLSLIDTAREIDFATKENLFPESFDNCFQYGACPYLKLCQQHLPIEHLNFEGFHIKPWDVLAEDEV
jgi:hypothetical protein